MATRLDKLLGRPRVDKNSIDAFFLKNKLMSEMGGDENIMREPYKKSDLVYICISTTAKAISQAELVAAKILNASGEHQPLPSDNAFQKLFERPNYLTDRYSFVESIISYLLLDGDVFVLPFPPSLSPPASLWVVREKFIKPAKDKKTGQLLGWYYNPSGLVVNPDETLAQGSIPLHLDEVCHIFLFNPYDPIKGLAPLEAGKINVISDYKAAVYTSVFFDEGAQPGGVLTAPGKLGNTQFDRARSQFESRHQGFRRGHRLAVLEQGLTYTATGLSQKDMEFKDLRKLTAERIYQIFGMKKAILSVTEDVNYATSREQRKEWWETTNIPLMKMITSALSFTLFQEESKIKAIFDLSGIDALKEALSGKVETGYKLWQMGYTANEINARLDFGFGKKPWRDRGYMAVNLVPIPVKGELPETVGEEESRFLPRPSIKLLSSGGEIKDERNDAIWRNLILRLDPLEESFSKKVSRVFFDMRKKTLELLYKEPKHFKEGLIKAPSDIENELFSEESSEMDRLTDPIYKQGLLTGAATVIEEVGFSIAFDLTDPEAISFLMDKKIKIRGTIQTIKDQIKIELVEAYEKGESIDKIANRIRNVFDVAKSRARTIARTEVVGAANESRSITINRSGFKEKTWWTAMDEKVRPQHSAMHGKIVEVGKSWVFPDGTSVRHPGDYAGPAHQIINCRCIETVVPGSHYLD